MCCHPCYFHRWLFLIICVHATSLLSHLTAADQYSLSIVTDRADALYEVGDQATFQITVNNGERPAGEGTVSFAIDDFLVAGKSGGFPAGKLPLGSDPVKVVVKGQRPGFLRCQVAYQPSEGKQVKAVAAAGFSPTEIKPSLPVPEDFDEFWADQKRQLAEVPIDAKLTPVQYADESIECYDVQVPCLGGAPVSGYLSKPKDAETKSLPAILWVHGAGVRSSTLPNAVKGARAGMLSMDINAHGIPNGKPLAFYAKLSSGQLKSYRHAGREHRDTIYFRGMFLRLVRAIDFLTAQPEWNGKEVVVIGHSQGGGQSLVAGGLDDRVTMIAPGVPAIPCRLFLVVRPRLPHRPFRRRLGRRATAQARRTRRVGCCEDAESLTAAISTTSTTRRHESRLNRPGFVRAIVRKDGHPTVSRDIVFKDGARSNSG